MSSFTRGDSTGNEPEIQSKAPERTKCTRFNCKIKFIDRSGRDACSWTGRNIVGSHYGTIGFLSGSITILRRQPDKVSFVLDMHSIHDLDIQDPSWNLILVYHLKSDELFRRAAASTAQFDATAFKPIEGAKGVGIPNYEVHGNLTIKGISNPISFPAVLTQKEDGSLAAEAHFDRPHPLESRLRIWENL